MSNTAYVIAIDLAVVSTQSIRIEDTDISLTDYLSTVSPIPFPYPWTDSGWESIEPLLAFLDDVVENPPGGMEILVPYPSTNGLLDNMELIVAALEPPLTRFHQPQREPETPEEAVAMDMDNTLLRQQAVLAPYGSLGAWLLFPGWEWFTWDEVQRMIAVVKAHTNKGATFDPDGRLDPEIWMTIDAYASSYDLVAFVATL